MSDRHPSGPHYPTGSADEVGLPSHETYDGLGGHQYGGSDYSSPYGGYLQDPYGQAPAAPDFGGQYPDYSHQQSTQYAQQPYGQDPYGQTGGHGVDPYASTGAWAGDQGQFGSTGAHAPYGFDGGDHAATGGYDVYDSVAPTTDTTTAFPDDATWGGAHADTGQQPTAGWHHNEWGGGGGWHGEASQDTSWQESGYAAATATAVIPVQPSSEEWDTAGSAAELAAQPTQTFQTVDLDGGHGGEHATASTVEHDLSELHDLYAARETGAPHDPYDPSAGDPGDADDFGNGAPRGGHPETGRDDEAAFDVTPLPAARRTRRRPKPRRSALLSVAAPSLCVLGVTAVAAGAISQPDTISQTEEDVPLAAPDPTEVEPRASNEEFDSQLQGLTAAADDYADRASRTQDRLDLKEWEAEEERKAEEAQRKAEEEAARKEAERPKFSLPVDQTGLSKGYNEAGMAWIGLHTGIDFPVAEGTPVRAATDGSVRTQYNLAYGNMLILTAPDGTETWYAHLSSTVVQSGQVQAGTVVAYSGNTGNSMGPHLHFEVRPGGGTHIDPSAWLRDKGLEPGY